MVPAHGKLTPRTTTCAHASDVALAGLDSQTVLQHFGKGKPVPAIIEAVSSGASLRATLLPEQYFVSVMLVGIVCPSMNRRPPTATGAAAGAPASASAQAPTTDSAQPAVNGTAAPGQASHTLS